MKRIIAVGMLLGCAGCATQVNEAADAGSEKPVATGKTAPQVAPRRKKAAVPDDAFGKTAEAVDALCVAAENEDGEKVRIAETWLLRQGSRPVTPLARILLDEKGEMAHRIVACRVLRKMGAAAKPAWKKALDSQSQQVRINAMRGLASLKPSDLDTLQALAALLDEADDTLQGEAAAALAKIGPPAADVCADKLLAILNDAGEQDAVRDAAKRALQAVRPRHTLDD